MCIASQSNLRKSRIVSHFISILYIAAAAHRPLYKIYRSDPLVKFRSDNFKINAARLLNCSSIGPAVFALYLLGQSHFSHAELVGAAALKGHQLLQWRVDLRALTRES